MKAVLKLALLLVLVGGALAAAAVGYLKTTGLNARATPGDLETRVARRLRALAVPDAERQRTNPVPATAENFNEGLEHFADHCAVCHASDGSGQSDIGKGLYPKPPDLRAAATQSLTDGEIFHIIENGVRFTGMPAFGGEEGHGGDGSWVLVHFIRHLPRLTDAERKRMEALISPMPSSEGSDHPDAAGKPGPASPPHDHSTHRH